MRTSVEARICAVLLGVTLANWLLMELGLWHLPVDSRVLGTAILVLALVKVRLIVRYFMEVRDAPRALGWTFDAWLAAALVSLSLHSWIAAA